MPRFDDLPRERTGGLLCLAAGILAWLGLVIAAIVLLILFLAEGIRFF